MISSLVGAVVMSAATVAMLVAIQITNESLKKVGRHPLTIEERDILLKKFDPSQIDLINQEIEMLDFEN